MSFTETKLKHIGRRGELDGYDGLTYTRKPVKDPKPHEFITKKPDFKGALAMMDDESRREFEHGLIKRQEFLDSKPNLAGKRNVSAYEDKEVLRFDPLAELDEKKAGDYAYDSGRHQGGESGATFVKTNRVYRAGRFTRIDVQPDAYATKLPNSIKIRS